jgi:hypothetical protein
MSGSNSVGSSFSPLASDGNAGSNGFAGVLNGAGNAAGLAFALPAGASATGVTIDNASPYWLQVVETLAAGATAAAGYVTQSSLVHPQGSLSLAFNGDDQTSLVVKFVADPAVNTVVASSALVALSAAAVTGQHRVTVNYINE